MHKWMIKIWIVFSCLLFAAITFFALSKYIRTLKPSADVSDESTGLVSQDTAIPEVDPAYFEGWKRFENQEYTLMLPPYFVPSNDQDTWNAQDTVLAVMKDENQDGKTLIQFLEDLTASDTWNNNTKTTGNLLSETRYDWDGREIYEHRVRFSDAYVSRWYMMNDFGKVFVAEFKSNLPSDEETEEMFDEAISIMSTFEFRTENQIEAISKIIMRRNFRFLSENAETRGGEYKHIR